jgi:uncharacterized protein YidB (DUF937 family)
MMGILNDILQRFGGQGQGEEKHNALLDAVIGLISQPQTGGLAGLLDRFKSQGLGDTISSWIGTGQNQPIDPDQVEKVLGPDQVQDIAAKLGVSTEEVSQGLAKLLPEVVDKATPQGTIPPTDSLGERLGAVKKLLGG